jgi:hypothetical protein
MAMVNERRINLGLAAIATGLMVLVTSGPAAGETSPSPAAQSSISALRQDLQLAVCLGHWEKAVDIAGAIIASPEISAERRAELVRVRYQLQDTLQRQSVINATAYHCGERLARYVQALPVAHSTLDWDGAFYSAYGIGPMPAVPDQVGRQEFAAKEAGLTQTVETEIPALSPARVIPTPNGAGVSAGAVSTGVDVFTFVGGVGDQVSIDVIVTEVLPGRLHTDDDSQIFLFDSEGTLLAENDDLSRLQSQLADVTLPSPGTYYVAVTTYNNDPILDAANRITGWNGNGGSSIEYTIAVTGLTPVSELVLPVVQADSSAWILAPGKAP